MTYKNPASTPATPFGIDANPGRPSQAAVLEALATRIAHGLRVSMPCKVVAVRGNQTVDVQPLLQTRYVDGSVKPLPVIPGATVCAPMGLDYSFKLPLAVGDTGLAVFADRSLDAWYGSDGQTPVDPQDSRAHHLTDCIYLPGLPVASAQTTDATADMVLRNGRAVLRMQKAGTFQVTNGTAELIDQVEKLAAAVADLATSAAAAVSGAPGGPVVYPPVVTQPAAIKATVTAIQTAINTLKGA